MAGEVRWDYYEGEFPHERVAVARRLCERLEDYGRDRGIAWKRVMYESYFAFQVDRSSGGPGKDWTGVCMFKRKSIEFTVKFPKPPNERRANGIYPHLKPPWWSERTSQWQWEIPNLGAVPDVALARDASSWRR